MSLSRELQSGDGPEDFLYNGWSNGHACIDRFSTFTMLRMFRNGHTYTTAALELPRAPTWIWERLKPKIMGMASPTSLKYSYNTQEADYTSLLLELHSNTPWLQLQLQFKDRFLLSRHW